MTETLKPCPNPWCEFASGKKNWHPENPRVWPFYVYDANEAGTLTKRVECSCGIKGPHFSDDESAIVAWNQRPTPKAVEGYLTREQIEKLMGDINSLAYIGDDIEQRRDFLLSVCIMALNTLDAEEAMMAAAIVTRGLREDVARLQEKLEAAGKDSSQKV